MSYLLARTPLSRKLPIALILLGIIGGSLATLGNYTVLHSLLRHRAMEAITRATELNSADLEKAGDRWINTLLRQANDPIVATAARDLIEGWNGFFGDRGEMLRRLFITFNTYPKGQRDKLETIDNRIPYSISHKRYHARLRRFSRFANFTDLLIVTPEWDVVYSVRKNNELGRNLTQIQDAGLARLIDRASKLHADQAWLSAETRSLGETKPDEPPQIVLLVPILSENAHTKNNKNHYVQPTAWLIATLDTAGVTNTLNPLPRWANANPHEPTFHIMDDDLHIRSDSDSALNSDEGIQSALDLAIESAVLNGASLDEYEIRDAESGETKNIFLSLHRSIFLGLDWFVIGVLPADQIAADLIEPSLYILSVTLGLVLLLALVSGQAISRFVYSIEMLFQEIEQLSYTEDVDVLQDWARRDDEIGCLAQRMLDAQLILLEHERINAQNPGAQASNTVIGKFAGTSNDVNSLTKQTKNATTQITNQIGSIQEIARAAATNMRKMSNIIDQMGQITSSIGSAIATEAQTARSRYQNKAKEADISLYSQELQGYPEDIDGTGMDDSFSPSNTELQFNRIRKEMDHFLHPLDSLTDYTSPPGMKAMAA